MEHRLDTHLKQLDEQAIEDGEARELLYCWYCSGYFPREKMGDVMCLECEGLGGPKMVRDLEIVKAAVGQVRAKEEQVEVIRELVQMTLEEGRR